MADSSDEPGDPMNATAVLNQQGMRAEIPEGKNVPLRPGEKVEVINGQTVLHPPIMLRHNQVRMNLSHLLAAHVHAHELGLVGEETLFVVLSPNNYGPDVVFFSREKAAQFKPEQIRFPTPDFIAEVLSPTTENLDRGLKYRDYADHGVPEYWLVDPTAEFVEQYENVDGRFSLMGKSTHETICSRVIPGFEIPTRAIFEPVAHLETLKRLACSTLDD